MLSVSKKLWLKCNCYIIFIMSSKSIHHTSNKKFSDFRQLSKQHHQVEICETSHFSIILKLVAYKLVYFCWNKQVFVSLKLQEMCILATWNFHGKNELMLKIYFLPLSWDKRQLVICVTFWAIFFDLRYFHDRIWQTLGNAWSCWTACANKQYKTVIICWNNLKSLCSWLNTCN